MIKFVSRPNIIYLFQLILWSVLRKVEVIIMREVFDFGRSSFFTLLMFIGEFLAGLIIYRYLKSSFAKKKVITNPKSLMSIELIQNEKPIIFQESIFKLYFLILCCSFFDFVEFTLSFSYLSKFYNLSGSLESRMSGILSISSALFFYFLLKLEIFRHQFFSLIVIGICLIIVIITEFFFQGENIFLPYWKFAIALAIIFFIHFFNSLVDSIEKYLFEYNYFNPFFALMLEGIFGIIITLLFCFVDNFFNDLSKYYKDKSRNNFIGLIFLFILYIILSGGRNLFRVITNKIYSPVVKSLTDYLLNPIYIIIDFSRKKDFFLGGERKPFYFVVNLVISFIISICGCVYNEFIVLFCCKLEHDTHYEISRRAILMKEITRDDSMTEMINYYDEYDNN